MSYIYVLKQKELNRRKVGLSINPTDRIRSLESTWGKFDKDSVIYKFDLKTLDMSLGQIEKLIHSFLKINGLHIKDLNTDLDGSTEFFYMEKDKNTMSHFIDIVLKDKFLSKIVLSKSKFLTNSTTPIKKKRKKPHEEEYRIINGDSKYKIHVETNCFHFEDSIYLFEKLKDIYSKNPFDMEDKGKSFVITINDNDKEDFLFIFFKLSLVKFFSMSGNKISSFGVSTLFYIKEEEEDFFVCELSHHFKREKGMKESFELFKNILKKILNK